MYHKVSTMNHPQQVFVLPCTTHLCCQEGADTVFLCFSQRRSLKSRMLMMLIDILLILLIYIFVWLFGCSFFLYFFRFELRFGLLSVIPAAFVMLGVVCLGFNTCSPLLCVGCSSVTGAPLFIPQQWRQARAHSNCAIQIRCDDRFCPNIVVNIFTYSQSKWWRYSSYSLHQCSSVSLKAALRAWHNCTTRLKGSFLYPFQHLLSWSALKVDSVWL